MLYNVYFLLDLSFFNLPFQALTAYYLKVLFDIILAQDSICHELDHFLSYACSFQILMLDTEHHIAFL